MGICKRRKRFYIITEFLPMGNLRRVSVHNSARDPPFVKYPPFLLIQSSLIFFTWMMYTKQWIQDGSKEFGWDTRISFAIDISLALAYLHHKNIIHR